MECLKFLAKGDSPRYCFFWWLTFGQGQLIDERIWWWWCGQWSSPPPSCPPIVITIPNFPMPFTYHRLEYNNLHNFASHPRNFRCNRRRYHRGCPTECSGCSRNETHWRCIRDLRKRSERLRKDGWIGWINQVHEDWTLSSNWNPKGVVQCSH